MTEALHTIAPEGNFAVEASAGTGKTWLLTSRILRLLLDGAPPGSILAITFTRKAAAEIRQRVHERLLEFALNDDTTVLRELEQLGLDRVDASLLQTARGLFETVLTTEHAPRISTIHGFCQDLLQRFPLESRLPPGFQVTEAATEARDTAWTRFQRDLTTARQDSSLARSFEHLLRWLQGTEAVREALSAFLDHRDDWWAYTEGAADPVGWAVAELDRALPDATEPPDEASLRRELREYAKLLGRHTAASFQKTAQALNHALTAASSRDLLLEQIRSQLHTATGSHRSLKPSSALERSLGREGVERIVSLHHSLAEAVDRWLEMEHRIRNRESNRAWFTCGNALLEHFQAEKRRHGQIDFADLEWQTYQLLSRSRHAEWVQYKIDQRIDHLLIDEFQDTSPVQWQLVQPLLTELAAGDPERRRSVFLVGDTKQSIYRFRRAQPELFARARQWMQKHVDAGDTTQRRSRRSSPAIMDFVNLVFAEPGQGAQHPYSLPNFAEHDTHHSGLWGRVELLPLAKAAGRQQDDSTAQIRNPLQQTRTGSSSRAGTHAEGQQIAAVIQSLLDAPISDAGAVRPIGYGDFLILVRSRTHVGRIEQELRAARIPYNGAARDPISALPEVHDVVHLLQALLAPLDDVNLASALRSPIFDCSEEDLIELARLPETFWWQRLQHHALGADPRNEALLRAYTLLDSWRQQVDRVPVHDLLDRIYADTNLVERYIHAAPPQYTIRLRASLNQVLDHALEMDAGRYPSLSRFVHSLSGSSSEPATALPQSAEGDRVRIMTIHSAKGLESPVVILADAARVNQEPVHRTRTVIDWPAGADRPHAFRIAGRKDELDTLTRAMLQKQSDEHQREEANLLYVALTRARQYLYITATIPGKAERGWYGHIAQRLQREFDSPTLAPKTLVTVEDTGADDETPGDRHFFLCHGEPPAVAPAPAGPALNAVDIDPGLRVPPPPARRDAWINPSTTGMYERSHFTDSSEDPKTGETGRERGILIHNALELLTTIEPVESARRQWLYRSAGSAEELRESCWREALAVVQDGALQRFFDAATYDWARNELPLLFRMPEGIVYGIADRVVANAEGLWLLDYKTHVGATSDTVSQLASAYREQLHLYAEGLARLWPDRAIHPVLLFTSCRELVPIDLIGRG